MRDKLLFFLLTSFLFYVSNAAADTDNAVFAGGCFWCMDADFEKLNGVKNVVSGFTGGAVENPTYYGDHQGHYEAVRITYDSAKISYQELLNYFWVNIDPFDAGGQFCDKGPSYLSAIFVANKNERKLAQESRQKVVEKFPDKKIVTPILTAKTFYPVRGKERFHQDFYKKSSLRYRLYRWSCGRDQRLKEIWGDKATH